MTKRITIKSDQYEGIRTNWDHFNEDLYQNYLFVKKLISEFRMPIETASIVSPSGRHEQLELISQNKFKSN